jgi:effector-binding domain-containing protein
MFAKATALSIFVTALVTNGAVAATVQPKSKESTMQYEIQVQEVAAQAALVVKGKVNIEKAGDAIGANIGAVSALLESKKLQPAGAPFTRTYSFENGVMEFESGFPVVTTTKGQGDVIGTQLPKGQVATTVHVGTHEGSEQAYAAIEAWMKANKKQPAGAPWEVYLSETKMQVFFPIR